MQTHQWNSDKLQSDFAHCENLKDLILEVEKHVENQGHVVCDIYVNGTKLDEQDESDLATAGMATIFHLKVTSQDPDVLLKKTLGDTLQLIEVVDELSIKTSEAFRQQHLEQAHKSFSELLELMGFLTEVTFLVESEMSAALRPQYRQLIMDIDSAYQMKDLVLLADLLEYELTNVLSQLKEEISKVRARATMTE
jgi:hypothetical protein